MKNDFSFKIAGKKVDLITGELLNLNDKSIYCDSDLEEIKDVLSSKNNLNKYSYTLVPTYECNFKCSYCFEENINDSFGITEEDITNFFSHIKSPSEVSNINIMGGEPLLPNNKNIIIKIIKEIERKKYNYCVTTNGYELDSYLNILEPYKPENIQVTIDGPLQIHDKRRIHKISKKSYTKILNNIKLLLGKGFKITVRTNVDETNVEHLHTLGKDLKSKFKNFKNFNAYLYLISDGGCTGDKYCMPEPLGIKRILELKKEHQSMDIFQLKFHGSEFLNSIFEKKITNIKSAFCSACIGKQIIFAPNKELYNCLFAIGNSDFISGHYGKDIEFNLKEKKKWETRNIFNLNKCSSCKFKFICGGGCANKSMKYNGNIMDVYCPDYLEIFKEYFNQKELCYE